MQLTYDQRKQMKSSAWKAEEGAIASHREAYGGGGIVGELNLGSGKKSEISLKSYNTMSGAKSSNPIKSRGKMPNMFATKKIKDKQEKKLAEKDATFLFKEGIKTC